MFRADKDADNDNIRCYTGSDSDTIIKVATHPPKKLLKVLSQLPVAEMSWGKKSKKKPSVLINFHFPRPRVTL